MSFNILAEELKEGIVLLNNSGQIEYCNIAGLKFFHTLSGAKHYKKLLSHFAESKQLFEFEKNIELFTKAHSIKKDEYDLDFISLNGEKINVFVKLRLLDHSSSCNLVLIFYIDENLRLESETKGEDLFFDELGLLEKKAENLLDYTDKLKKTKEQQIGRAHV